MEEADSAASGAWAVELDGVKNPALALAKLMSLLMPQFPYFTGLFVFGATIFIKSPYVLTEIIVYFSKNICYISPSVHLYFIYYYYF